MNTLEIANNKEIQVKEIFSSIQGEGVYAGQKHLFLRTTKCNLKCKYCDTDFKVDKNVLKFSFDELFNEIKKHDANILSLTGGEPLLDANFFCDFLKKYKNRINKKVYLETNGTLPVELKKIIDYVDIIAMDIKLTSATQENHGMRTFSDFLSVARKKEVFLKLVFDKNITDEEISQVSTLAKKYNVELVLQPKMPLDKKFDIQEVFDKFHLKYKNIRLVAQTHKFLNLR